MSNKKFSFKSMLVGVIVGAGLFGSAIGASTLVKGDVYINQYPILVNNSSYKNVLPILNYQGSTYVPLKELATVTGTEVKFQNSKIYINNKKQNTATNTTTNTTTQPTYTSSKVELEEKGKTIVPVNLSKYNATSATATVSDNCVKLSQSVFTNSGNLTIYAEDAGKATVTVKYNTGSTDYILVTVIDDNEEDIEVAVGDYENFYIDLDDYDAKKATISVTSGSSYVTLNKKTFTSSGNLQIIGKNEGNAEVRIKYDTGYVTYINVEVTEAEDSYDEDLEILKNDYEEIYIDLDDYNAKKATISITSGSSYITLNKSTFTTSGDLRITGKKVGNATIRIKFDTGVTEYLYVEVTEEEADYYDYEYEDEFILDETEYGYIYVDLGAYNANKADIKVIAGSSYVTLNKTSTTTSRNIKVTGIAEGDAIVEVEYNTGDVEYYWFEVYSDEEDAVYNDYEYEDEFVLYKDEYDNIYIDLEYYDAYEATLRIVTGKSYITVAKMDTTISRDIRVTGKAEGEAIVEVEYDTGDIEYYWFEIVD